MTDYPIDLSLYLHKQLTVPFDEFDAVPSASSGNSLELWAKAKQMTIYDAAIDLCR